MLRANFSPGFFFFFQGIHSLFLKPIWRPNLAVLLMGTLDLGGRHQGSGGGVGVFREVKVIEKGLRKDGGS